MKEMSPQEFREWKEAAEKEEKAREGEVGKWKSFGVQPEHGKDRHQDVQECPYCGRILPGIERPVMYLVGFSTAEKFRPRGRFKVGAVAKKCPHCLNVFWHHVEAIDLWAYGESLKDYPKNFRYPEVVEQFHEMLKKVARA